MDKKYLPQLDALRAVAAILVMFGHFTLSNPHLTKFDHFIAPSGVNLFFVLSGFLISKILLDDRDTYNSGFYDLIKTFYIRRFLRIFPLYYFFIFLGIIFAIPLSSTDFPWLILYVANFKTIINNGNLGYFTHLWSLSVEQQFYIFFPFILLLTPVNNIKHLALILIAVGVLTRCLAYFIPVLQPVVHWFCFHFTACCMDSFGLGLLMAFYFNFQKLQIANFLNKFNYIFILVLLMAIVPFSLYDIDSFYNGVFFRLLTSIIGFWLIGKAAMGSFTGIIKSFLENKVVLYLGKISYGLYVYHFPMLWFFRKFGFTHSPSFKAITITFLFCSIATVIVASVSYYVLERPILKLKKRFVYKSVQ